jgi:iron(III) transport system permease protein
VTQVWRADRAPLLLRCLAIVVGAAFAAPVLYVVWRLLTLDADLAGVVGESLAPLWRTVQLAAIVGISTGIVGTLLAWLLVRTDVPLARALRIVAPLPLVFPSFIGAAAFIAGLAPDGAIRSILELVGYHPPRRFRGLGASCLVLTAFTYPYVYLPVAARLAGQPASIEESARLLGDGTARLFVRVVLPSIRSSVLGGMLIVFLYSLSEFGAVQLLGYDTLTRVVYATRLLDRAASFAAASLLVILAIAAVTTERRVRGSLGEHPARAARRQRSIPLGRWRIPALLGVLVVLAVSLLAPLVSLAHWAWRGIDRSGSPLANLGDELSSLRDPAWSSAWLGVLASAVALLLVLPAAFLAGRYRSRITPVTNGTMLAGSRSRAWSSR